MKVFIYKKSNSKKIRVIKDVKCVYQYDNLLTVQTEKKAYTYNTKEVKTTCYQN